MALARSLERYLIQSGVDYEIMNHRPTHLSLESAHVSGVPVAYFAKGVVLGDERGYLLAVTPADHRVRLGALHRQLGRELGLATEDQVRELFSDCAPGAVPPLGQVYGLEVIVDDALNDRPEIYFEAGDHRELIRVSGRDFQRLLPGAFHGSISEPGTEHAGPKQSMRALTGETR